ncbi:hypothetical protein A4X09_0g303 [Tilletia walkeri]|uniref:Uncharacterized protein n=1 Tax=Tilletia walkeri TaxID=117179 RepID=A0A8X7NF10_9BASI|nr:hypothetical protein A4X09_0g303 [Tilletia walkeri]
MPIPPVPSVPQPSSASSVTAPPLLSHLLSSPWPLLPGPSSPLSGTLVPTVLLSRRSSNPASSTLALPKCPRSSLVSTHSSWSSKYYGAYVSSPSAVCELLGALQVMIFINSSPTAMPWLRLEAILLMLVWDLPHVSLERDTVKSAWRLADIFLPVSYGGAAGDISFTAYIQSTLAKMEFRDKGISTIGAIMAFLYGLYIAIYALVSSFPGRWVNSQDASGRQSQGARLPLDSPRTHSSTSRVSILLGRSTRGALAFNPKAEGDLATSSDDN